MRSILMTLIATLGLLSCNFINYKPSIQPQISDLQLTNVQLFHSSSGSLYAGGTVRNNSDLPLSNIRVEISVLDENSQALFSGIVRTSPERVAGHSMAIFTYPLTLVKGNPTQIIAKILEASENKEKLANVTVNTQKILNNSSGKFYLLGTFTNNETQPIELENAAAIGYDNSGLIVAISNQSVNSRYLASGDTTSFRIELDSNNTITLGDVLVQGVKITQITPVTISYSAASNFSFYSDSNGYFHLIGEVKNTGAEPINIGAISSLFSSDGTLLDVSGYSAPFSYVLPGQTASLDFSDFPIVSGDPTLAKTVANFSIQTDYGDTRIFPGKILSPKVIQTEATINQNQITLNGSVTNDTGEDLTEVIILAQLKDQNNKLIGVGSTTLFNLIKRGQSSNFTIYISASLDLELNQFSVGYSAQSISSNTSSGQPSQP